MPAERNVSPRTVKVVLHACACKRFIHATRARDLLLAAWRSDCRRPV